MPEPILTSVARTDLAAAWEYLAQYDAASADDFLERFWERANRHAKFPGMGRPRPDLRSDARSFVVGRHLVLLRPVADTIEVLRIVHGASDLKDALK